MTESVYPATLDGQFDPTTSRWLWLVKIFLILPHVVVLLFLWLGFFFATIGGGFPFLFPGRSPRALFGFTVGVMRWLGGVGFSSSSAFGPARYPPFSLR